MDQELHTCLSSEQWVDVMAAILKVWCHIINLTLSIDTYLFDEQSCKISSRSALKRCSLRLFFNSITPIRRTSWVAIRDQFLIQKFCYWTIEMTLLYYTVFQKKNTITFFLYLPGKCLDLNKIFTEYLFLWWIRYSIKYSLLRWHNSGIIFTWQKPAIQLICWQRKLRTSFRRLHDP